jgi:hypothetical protein
VADLLVLAHINGILNARLEAIVDGATIPTFHDDSSFNSGCDFSNFSFIGTQQRKASKSSTRFTRSTCARGLAQHIREKGCGSNISATKIHLVPKAVAHF